MASRDGARARGTDGRDFGHRETIASHYQISAENKRRLKLAIVFHCILTIYEVTKLSSEILQLLGIDFKDTYNVILPKSAVWEWIWVMSIFFNLPSLFAIKKNNVNVMKLFVAGISVCGILPLIWAILYLFFSGDLRTFFVLGTASSEVEKFNGVPLVALTTSFVALGFITHILSIMYARNLIHAWTPKKGKKA
uniref:Putative jagunal protein n=1 Tax=Cupiennius salei TaxID=6928 RepID=T1D1U8_CUPSA